ncbi:MAG: 4-alpha-glucanotransferase, partial [Chlamydiae bacterium]|nr:4-alpha-glucanotransferase [Chlamydiota bacterium]
ALNPLFLSLRFLPMQELVPNFEEKVGKIVYWNRTPRVKFHIVRELKNVFFKEYIPLVGPEIKNSRSYKSFIKENQSWLDPYVLFKSLKEKNYWKSWEDWAPLYKTISKETFSELLRENEDVCDFHRILQFLSFEQMAEVKKHAEDREIFLKGDLPILISRDSADVWYNRDLFLLDYAAGAPPDMYSRDGQYWGFPLFNMEQMEKQKFDWWKKRLEVAGSLYHIYRIDHVVGFFRMWAIPKDKQPKEGNFYPPEEHKWLPQGKQMMQMMLKASPLLPIGEDLGVVPHNVKQTLHDLGICGTKVMRWERRFETDGSYLPIEEFEETSMTTVSTHDSDTLQLWWRHFPKDAKQLCELKGWNYEPFLNEERHKEILYDSHHSSSLFHINLLNEYLALFPDLISNNLSDERINIPGKVLDSNWTYRFKPSVEELTSNANLKDSVKNILR